MSFRTVCVVVVCLLLPGLVWAGKKDVIKLPEPSLDSQVSLEKVLHQRRSVRRYSDQALDLKQVGQLLWAAYGISEPRSKPTFLRGGLRTAPSAGARYPLDLYLAAGKVKGLKAGLYFYDSAKHALRMISAGDKRPALNKGQGQGMVVDAPVTLIWTATFERNTSKYGQRGRERYVCMDVGHSGQNVYLQAEALGLGTVAVGAFDDAAVRKVLGVGEKEEPLYMMPVGVKK